MPRQPHEEDDSIIDPSIVGDYQILSDIGLREPNKFADTAGHKLLQAGSSAFPNLLKGANTVKPAHINGGIVSLGKFYGILNACIPGN